MKSALIGLTLFYSLVASAQSTFDSYRGIYQVIEAYTKTSGNLIPLKGYSQNSKILLESSYDYSDDSPVYIVGFRSNTSEQALNSLSNEEFLNVIDFYRSDDLSCQLVYSEPQLKHFIVGYRCLFDHEGFPNQNKDILDIQWIGTDLNSNQFTLVRKLSSQDGEVLEYHYLLKKIQSLPEFKTSILDLHELN